MSFEIDWKKLTSDQQLNDKIKEGLNRYFKAIQLPSYVSGIELIDFGFGKISPNVVLRDISSPLQDFYDAINEEIDEENSISDENYDGTSSDETGAEERQHVERKESDVQFLMELEYKGDISLTLTAELVLNYPVEKFMTLPLKITISSIGLHSLCLISYVSRQLFVSMLCDVSDPILDDVDCVLDPNGPVLLTNRPFERISIIRSMKIETEIGDQYKEDGSTLRSVNQLEEFIKQKMKDFLRKELAWPSWVNLDFNEE
ncbi:Mitochondrial distribution and morphology protein 12 [Nakaseomyces bracarensis]|uniref:Mitochondrial distribution and morphology protein 12 n=1 Tax=Nakaseomyces bracarensis TaxID=273131 RepID=A0ABR4NT80_9SACH